MSLFSQSDQPYPGAHFGGGLFLAYLPDTPEGREVLAMLRVAWGRRLTFRLATLQWKHQHYALL